MQTTTTTKRSETTTKIAAISQPTEAEEPRKRTTRRDDSSDYDIDDEGVSYEGGFSCDISGEYEDKLTRKQTHVLDNCRTTLDFKTKIICTLGPSSRTVEQLENLLQTGMSVARFNFSHGSHEYHRETLDNLRKATENTGLMCAVLLDTKGPEIRTGMLENGEPVQLHQGEELILTTDYEVQGNAKKIAVSYPDLAKDVNKGVEFVLRRIDYFESARN